MGILILFMEIKFFQLKTQSLTKILKDNPMNIATKIANIIKDESIEKVEIAPPGFINIYLTKQVLKVTYSASGVTSPQYFVKTSRAGTSSVAVTQSCGTGTNPGTCSSITSTTNLEANKWYKVSGNVNVTYSAAASTAGTLYAVTYDGNIYHFVVTPEEKIYIVATRSLRVLKNKFFAEIFNNSASMPAMGLTNPRSILYNRYAQ